MFYPKGAVQVLDPTTGKYAIYDPSKREIVLKKVSEGPYKDLPIVESSALVTLVPEAKDRPSKIRDLTLVEKQVLEAVKKNPESSIAEIGRSIGKTGGAYIYTRMKKNEFLANEIADIRKNHAERFDREIVPTAMDVHQQVLEDESIEPEKKKDWVAMAYRHSKALGEASLIQPAYIDIKSIQILIQNNMGGQDTIDISSDS